MQTLTHTVHTQVIKHLVSTSRRLKQLESDEFNPKVRLHLYIDLKHLLFLVAVVKQKKEELCLPIFACLSLYFSQRKTGVCSKSNSKSLQRQSKVKYLLIASSCIGRWVWVTNVGNRTTLWIHLNTKWTSRELRQIVNKSK